MSVAETTLHLQRVRVGNLPDFAHQVLQQSSRYGIVPITAQRAQSQARNPAASPDDIGLIVSYLGNRCVGYLGMFPVWLAEQDRHRKVLSLSTYFVGPEHRGSGAGTILLLHALTLGHDLFVVGYSEVAGRVFRAVGFRPASPAVFLNLRIDAAIVLPLLLRRLSHRIGSRGSRFVARVLAGARRLSRRTLEAAFRPLVINLLLRPLRVSHGELIASAVESIRSPEGVRQDGWPRGGPRFMRDDATVNWMIHHPWIVEEQSDRLDYAFSHGRELFRFLPFQFRAASSGRDLGYVVLRVSTDAEGTILRILDCVLVDERHRPNVLSLALREALRWSADRIECGEEFDPLLRSSLLYRVLTRCETRKCLVFTRDRSGPFGDRAHELKFGICDGDAPFT